MRDESEYVLRIKYPVNSLNFLIPVKTYYEELYIKLSSLLTDTLFFSIILKIR